MLIVTPNPAVDHTVRLTELRPGEVIRTGAGIGRAGGKGGNVARAAGCLGARARVVALVPRIGAEHLRALYAEEQLELAAVPVAGRVRTCTVLLEDSGRVTLLNEPGAEVDSDDWDRLVTTAVDRLAPGELIVCSGSLPPGAPADGYARIVAVGHERGNEVLVDAAAMPLALAVAVGADLVCPNLSEAEALIADRAGRSPGIETVHEHGDDLPERAQAAATALVGLGARWAAVTAGAAGVAIAGPSTEAWLPSVPVTVRNPIGAGDSFVAGVGAARESGSDWPAAIRRGTATGTASVEQEDAGVVDPRRVDEIERLGRPD